MNDERNMRDFMGRRYDLRVSISPQIKHVPAKYLQSFNE